MTTQPTEDLVNKLSMWIVTWARSLFPHEKMVRWVLLGFVAAIVAAMATTCRADEPSVRFEIGAQYLRGPAAAVVTGARWGAPRDAEWEADLILVGQTADDKGVMGVQAMYVDGFGGFEMGLGAAYFNRTTRLLGSQLCFTLMVGYRITSRWSLHVRHWSNSGTTQDNVGMDVITVGYKF